MKTHFSNAKETIICTAILTDLTRQLSVRLVIAIISQKRLKVMVIYTHKVFKYSIIIFKLFLVANITLY